MYRRSDRRYELGPSCIALGDAARVANPVLQAASIEADALARSNGSCTAVCVRDADEARVAEVFDFGPPFGAKARVGQSIPLVPPFGAVFVAWDPTDTEQWLARAESTLPELQLERCRRAARRRPPPGLQHHGRDAAKPRARPRDRDTHEHTRRRRRAPGPRRAHTGDAAQRVPRRRRRERRVDPVDPDVRAGLRPVRPNGGGGDAPGPRVRHHDHRAARRSATSSSPPRHARPPARAGAPSRSGHDRHCARARGSGDDRRAARSGMADRGARDPLPRGPRRRRHAGAGRGTPVDQRPLPDRVRPSPPGRARPDALRQGLLLRARAADRVRRRAGGLLLPRPRRRHRRPHAAQRLRRRPSRDAPRRRHHRGRHRGRRDVPRRAQPVHPRPGGREPRGAGPSARVDVGRHRAHARALAGPAPAELLRDAWRQGDPPELRGAARA